MNATLAEERIYLSFHGRLAVLISLIITRGIFYKKRLVVKLARNIVTLKFWFNILQTLYTYGNKRMVRWIVWRNGQ